MDALFSSGRIVDLVLALVAAEAFGLLLWRRSAGRALPLLCNLASGAALMLALRASLTGAHWTAVAGCLAMSGLAHGTEMILRLGRTDPAAPPHLDPHT